MHEPRVPRRPRHVRRRLRPPRRGGERARSPGGPLAGGAPADAGGAVPAPVRRARCRHERPRVSCRRRPTRPPPAGERRSPAATRGSGTSSVTGVGHLLRLIVRLDRLRLPLWLVGLGGTIVASALAVPPLYDTPEKVAGYATAVGVSPVNYLMSGRQVGLDTARRHRRERDLPGRTGGHLLDGGVPRRATHPGRGGVRPRRAGALHRGGPPRCHAGRPALRDRVGAAHRQPSPPPPCSRPAWPSTAASPTAPDSRSSESPTRPSRWLPCRSPRRRVGRSVWPVPRSRSGTWCVGSGRWRTTPWCGPRRSGGPSTWTRSATNAGGRRCCC